MYCTTPNFTLIGIYTVSHAGQKTTKRPKMQYLPNFQVWGVPVLTPFSNQGQIDVMEGVRLSQGAVKVLDKFQFFVPFLFCAAINFDLMQSNNELPRFAPTALPKANSSTGDCCR